MKAGKVRCDECVYWSNSRPDKINGGLLGDCHFNPPVNKDHYVPGWPVWPVTPEDEWCGHFQQPQIVEQETENTRAWTATEMLESVRASLRDYPDVGGDVEVMAEVDRIVKEAVGRAVTKRPPCHHKLPVLYCSNCRKIIVSRNENGTYRVVINTLGGTEDTVLTDIQPGIIGELVPELRLSPPLVCPRCFGMGCIACMPDKSYAPRSASCLCGGVGCNSCEPGGRG